jgi:hypothetical protein
MSGCGVSDYFVQAVVVLLMCGAVAAGYFYGKLAEAERQEAMRDDVVTAGGRIEQRLALIAAMTSAQVLAPPATIKPASDDPLGQLSRVEYVTMLQDQYDALDSPRARPRA